MTYSYQTVCVCLYSVCVTERGIDLLFHIHEKFLGSKAASWGNILTEQHFFSPKEVLFTDLF